MTDNEEKTIWRLFRREEGKLKWEDFDTAYGAWEAAQLMKPLGRQLQPYIHKIPPGGHPYPR